jgi:AbrB family looped-hinge helix DNA binding protein
MKTTIDKAGRIVIPKAIRDQRRLVPGTEVEIVVADDRIELILPDDREEAVLVEKDGRLVIANDIPMTMDETLALRDELREQRDSRYL